MLTNTQIKRLGTKDRKYRVLDQNGLYIEVFPSGKKSWRLRTYGEDDKEKQFTLGHFPEMSLEDARAAQALKLSSGLVTNRFEEVESSSFSSVAKNWHEAKLYRSLKNAKLEWRRVENYLLPAIGNKEISEVTSRDVLQILKKIEAEGHLSLAGRVKTITSQIFKYGFSHLLCDSDPTTILSGAIKKPVVKHHPAITDVKKFSEFLKRIDSSECFLPTVKLALKLAPYIFLRSGELRQLRPENVDFEKKIMVVEASTAKMKRDHLIPLSESMLGIVEDALAYSTNEYLFPGTRPNRPLSENTLNLSIRTLGYTKEEVVFHGFRSSFSTLAREELRLDDDLIELCMGHADRNKVRSAYNRAERIEERREVMQIWSDFLDRLLME